MGQGRRKGEKKRERETIRMTDKDKGGEKRGILHIKEKRRERTEKGGAAEKWNVQ